MPFLLVDQLAGAIPLVFIAYFYGNSAAGQAGLAFRSMLLPVALISGAVAQVYFKKSIDTVHENQSLRKLVLKVFFGLIIIGIFFFLPITFFAPQLVPWFFGSKWGEAGFIMAALSVSMIIKFPVSPLGNTFIVARRIKVQALWQISLLICNFLLVVLTFYFKFKLISYIWFLVVLDLIMYSIYFLLILKVSGSSKMKN
jgi:O-antigen/teichoic acid export membrane protein